MNASPELPPRSRARVLYVNDHLGYEGGAIHGGTRLYESVIPRLNSRGVRTSLCILGNTHPAATRLRELGVEVFFCERSKWDPMALRDLLKVVRNEGVNILHLNTMKSYILGRVACRLSGSKSIVHFHDTNSPGTLLSPVQRALVPWTDRAIAVSEHVGRFAVEEYGIPADRISVLQNGIDTDAFSRSDHAKVEELRKSWELGDNSIAVGVVGRIMAGKGQDLLIRSAKRLFQSVPNASLIFAGDGPMREECEQLAKDVGIATDVRFIGHRNDMPAVLAAFDLVVLPSTLDEGFPLSALEAMSVGKPVIAFDVGAMREINGTTDSLVLVPKVDGELLVSEMIEVLNDRDGRDKLAARARSRANAFGIEAYADRLVDVYQDLVS